MMRYELSPPVEAIEQRRSGVSDGLMDAVERGEMSAAIAEAVRASDEWARRTEAIRTVATEPLIDIVDADQVKLPLAVRERIARRAAAASLASERLPVAGHIVRIERIVTPRPGQLDAVMLAPLHVLLDAPSDAPGIWHGWLVTGETDYAGWWDFVLQEEDGPFDPEAAMVQIWNPVQMWLPAASRVVGRLALARLQALRALAGEFATGVETPSSVAPWPGRVAVRETGGGLLVVSGSPLGGADDPRHRYQEIYFAAAEAVREPARLALREYAAVPEGRAGALLRQLMAGAIRLAETLLPEPRVAVAMSADAAAAEAVPDLSWPGLARLRLMELSDEGEGCLEVTALGNESLTVEVCREALVEAHVSVAPGEGRVVAWDADATALRLVSASGRRLELGLRDTAGPA